MKALKPYIGRLADERVWEHLRVALDELQDAKKTATPKPAAKTWLDRLADEQLWQHLTAAFDEINGASDLARGRKQHRVGLLLGGAAVVAGAILIARSGRSSELD